MHESLSPRRDEQRGCIHGWCVTAHGHTVHPDDEDHRSAGIAATVRARPGEARGPGDETELEIGALRRVDDTETWIVIETGIGVSLALTRDGARVLQRRLHEAIESGGPLASDGRGGAVRCDE
ncbi:MULTISPECIES: hypothetical protein [Microbacterium]|uniref:hypothetical protein n=1 Tax=Microbacterium TaxID=33882 RepID=UPI0027818232|nr:MULTISPECIES: hypothetical protein [Microbacterium]MDQ1083000.1 hypothetical protein [Microbacterium sp. SORGH_AS_0344]MDQ1168233.1 hypothetical protein [Microbacterium proteolyticum]